MTTKSRLLEETKIFMDTDGESAGIAMGNMVELRRLLEAKQKTPLSDAILSKNGFEVLTPRVVLPFKTWRSIEHPNFWFDEYKEDREYLDDETFGLVKKGCFLISFASKRTDLKSVADLEDAMELSGIGKELTI